MSRSPLIAELAAQIRRLERQGQRGLSTTDELPVAVASVWSRLLPGVPHPRGCLIEWLSDMKGVGATSLAMLASQSVLRDGLWVVVDGRRQLHGPGLVPLSVDLERVVLVQPERFMDVLWSIEQSLRTRGIGAVFCDVDELSGTAFRRLQLAAEAGDSLGILLRPERLRHQPTWAEYRFLVRPWVPNKAARASVERTLQPRRCLLVTLLRAPGEFTSRSVVVELSDEDGRVCLVTELATATSAVRATGA